VLLAGCSSGGGGGGGAGGGGGGGSTVSSTNSTLDVDAPFGLPADGTASTLVTVTVLDTAGKPMAGQVVQLTATGAGAVLAQPTAFTDAAGVATGTLAATVAGVKGLRATVNPGPGAVVLAAAADVEFLYIPAGSRFVRESGSDTNTGLTPLEAWRTLSHAASLVQPGETVWVGAGTYAESVTLATAGTQDAPIVFRGDADGAMTGDAGRVIVDAGGSSFGWRLAGASNAVVRGFTVLGAVPAGGVGGGIWIDGGANVFVAENELFDNERAISARDAINATLECNRVSNNLSAPGDGIVLTDCAGVAVRNNLVYNNGRYGLLLSGGVIDLDFALNTFYANQGDQIREQGTGNAGTMRASLVIGGAANGIRLVSGSTLVETDNQVWGNALANLTYGAGGAEAGPSGSADPLFADPAGADGLLGGLEGLDDDFLVDPASPAIDAGGLAASGLELAFWGAATGLTSRTDGELDGSGTDGLTVNLGFHLPGATDPVTPLESNDIRLLYASSTDPRVRGKTRTALTRRWSSSETRSVPLNTGIKWVVSEVSPLSTAEEVLAVLADDGTTTELFARRFDGRSWSESDPFVSIRGTIASADSDERGFDVAYERASGEALLVYADGSAIPRFRRLQDGQWSAAAPVLAAPAGLGKVLWVELAPRPGTDELALATLDDQANLVVAIWDGDAWGAPLLLDNQIITFRETRAFDLCYETLSGDLLVAYGHTNLIEETRYATRSAATETWSVRQAHSTDAVGAVFRLAANPTTDQIVAGVAEGFFQKDTVGMIWDGDQWTDIAEMDLGSSQGQRELSVAWLGGSGQAVILWRSLDGPGLDWARFNSGGWRIQPDALFAGMSDIRLSQARSLPGEDRILVVALDEADQLFALICDGTRWAIENSGQPLATGLGTSPNSSAVPFWVSIRR